VIEKICDGYQKSVKRSKTGVLADHGYSWHGLSLIRTSIKDDLAVKISFLLGITE